MGKVTGFKEYSRETPARRPVAERVHDYFEVYQPFPDEKVRVQGARCMDCGIPFCHTGCPVSNIIPDWNDLVYHGLLPKEAIRVLHSTNNFPELTGRICPAPCEAACVLGINEPPVTIKLIEKTIVDRAWEEGWILPEPPETRTGKRIAVVGSGPSGLAAAQQLNRAGHTVTVFEKSDRIGDLLRYGIPDFKLEKRVLDRRLIEQMLAEGVQFQTNAHVGGNIPAQDFRKEFDAVEADGRCGGSARPSTFPAASSRAFILRCSFCLSRIKWSRAIPFPIRFRPAWKTRGDHRWRRHRRGLPGYLPPPSSEIHSSVRDYAHAACSGVRHTSTPWPLWPLQLRTESAHEEGGKRDWALNTAKFTGDEQGNVKQLHALRVGPPPKFEALAGTEFVMETDLVLLALGFTGPVKKGMIDELCINLDARGNIATGVDYMSSVRGVFAAGDMRRGQSLVVWAIAEGRKAALAVDKYLMGSSNLA